MHKNFGADRTCSSEVMIADEHTHTQTDRHAHHNTPRSIQYHARTYIVDDRRRSLLADRGWDSIELTTAVIGDEYTGYSTFNRLHCICS